MANRPIKNGMRNSPAQQQGAALVVGLLILLVLTLLGVTSMSSSTMEERMSANSMSANIAFQMAESAVIAAMNNGATLTTAENTPGPAAGPTVTSGADAVGDAGVTYVGNGIVEGASLETYSAHLYQVRARGTVNAANAVSVTDQGTAALAPGSGP